MITISIVYHNMRQVLLQSTTYITSHHVNTVHDSTQVCSIEPTTGIETHETAYRIIILKNTGYRWNQIFGLDVP